MNRRHFLKLSGTGAAVAVLTPLTVLETGCAFSVSGTLSVIIEAVGGILSYVGGSLPWVADLQAALTALQTAEANWKAGSPAAIVIDALNTVEAVLAVIPLTAIYSPLIDIIVSGIEAVLNYFTPATTPPVTLTKPRSTAQTNPHLGRIPLKQPHSLQTYQGAFKDQFNETAKGLGLTAAEIA
jgi:hypothetical protein